MLSVYAQTMARPWSRLLPTFKAWLLSTCLFIVFQTSDCIVFIFFQILRFQIRGAAYLQMQLIYGRLQYVIEQTLDNMACICFKKKRSKIFLTVMSSLHLSSNRS